MIQLPYPLSVNRYWTIDVLARRIVPTAEGRQWKARARMLAQAQRPAGAPFSGALMVDILLHPRTRADGEASGVVVDLDNAQKLALDAMQGVVYGNDRQIADLRIRLGQASPGGGMTVSVAPL